MRESDSVESKLFFWVGSVLRGEGDVGNLNFAFIHQGALFSGGTASAVSLGDPIISRFLAQYDLFQGDFL